MLTNNNLIEFFLEISYYLVHYFDYLSHILELVKVSIPSSLICRIKKTRIDLFLCERLRKCWKSETDLLKFREKRSWWDASWIVSQAYKRRNYFEIKITELALNFAQQKPPIQIHFLRQILLLQLTLIVMVTICTEHIRSIKWYFLRQLLLL